MKLCPHCKHSTKEMQKVVKDKKKHWLITFCPKCQFNFDLEEFTDKAPTKDELDKYQYPAPFNPPFGQPSKGWYI